MGAVADRFRNIMTKLLEIAAFHLFRNKILLKLLYHKHKTRCAICTPGGDRGTSAAASSAGTKASRPPAPPSFEAPPLRPSGTVEWRWNRDSLLHPHHGSQQYTQIVSYTRTTTRRTINPSLLSKAVPRDYLIDQISLVVLDKYTTTNTIKSNKYIKLCIS